MWEGGSLGRRGRLLGGRQRREGEETWCDNFGGVGSISKVSRHLYEGGVC